MNAFVIFQSWQRCLSVVFGLTVLAGLAATSARATERRFSYTYETGVLPAGQMEIETWSTWHYGRDKFYNRFDERLELEAGLTDRLQTALYFNYSGLTQDQDVGSERVRTTTSEFQGLSSEWKLQLSNPVADIIGSALYFELAAGLTEAEIEAKILLDKRMGNVLAALNIIGELEWEFADIQTVTETVLETDVALGYFVTPKLLIGGEARTHTEVVDGAWEHSVLFAGATVSYAQDRWWFAASYLPQIGNYGGAHGHAHGNQAQQVGNLELTEHEKVEARLLFGFHM